MTQSSYYLQWLNLFTGLRKKDTFCIDLRVLFLVLDLLVFSEIVLNSTFRNYIGNLQLIFLLVLQRGNIQKPGRFLILQCSSADLGLLHWATEILGDQKPVLERPH